MEYNNVYVSVKKQIEPVVLHSIQSFEVQAVQQH